MKAISTLTLFLLLIVMQTTQAQTCTGFSVEKPITTDAFNTSSWGQTNGSFTYNSSNANYEATSNVANAELTITSPSFSITTPLTISVGASILPSVNNSNKLQSVKIEVLENNVVIDCYQQVWHSADITSTIGASFNGLIGKTVQFRFVMKREDSPAERTILFDNFSLDMPTAIGAQTCTGLLSPKPATFDEFNTATWGATNGSFIYNSTNKNYEVTSSIPKDVFTITSVPFNVTSALPVLVGAEIWGDVGNSNKIESVKIEVLENGVVINCYQQGWSNLITTIGASFLGLNGKTVQFRFVIKRDDTQAERTTFFDNFSLQLPEEVILPVTFIDIAARKYGNSVSVIWTVADEIDVKGYEIESSTNGITFNKIGFVPAARQSSYTFTDTKPQNGINYYRVRNVDSDGKSKYSSIARINLSTLLSLKAFPLPATNAVTIEHGIAARGTLTLSTIEGKALKAQTVAEGTSQTTLDLSGLQKGMYLVRFVKETGTTETLKVIKQ